MDEGGGRSTSLYLLAGFLGLFTLLTVAGFMMGWRTDVVTREGEGIDGVITYLLWTTGALVVIGHVVLIWFLWKYTAGKAAAYNRPNKRTQMLWGLLPVIVLLLVSEGGVLAVASPVWKSLYIDQPKDPFLVEVVGKQFEWYIRYPGPDGKFGRVDFKEVDAVENQIGLLENDEDGLDDIVKNGVLTIPKGRPCVIRLRTQDVIHSFFVPQFRVKQDLISGFPTRIKFTPLKAGEYELACAELCGLGHYNMKGKVVVMEPDEFEAWLAKQEPFWGPE
jgi:cytochrome c oxidase subunit 2